MKLFNSLALGALTAIVLAPSAHASTTNISDGATPASGETLATMTVPKFAEIKGVPASWAFTVTPAMYAANTATDPGLDYISNALSFSVRTNSTAGAVVKVDNVSPGDGRVSQISPADIAFRAFGGYLSGVAGLDGTSPQTVRNFNSQIIDFPTSPNLELRPYIKNINKYHVGGTGPTVTKDFTNTLVFTVLPK